MELKVHLQKSGGEGAIGEHQCPHRWAEGEEMLEFGPSLGHEVEISIRRAEKKILDHIVEGAE